MTAFEFQFADADQKVYDRGDEWFLYDDDLLYDSTPDELDEYETTMGYRIIRLLTEIDQWGAKAVRAATWIGRRKAGVVEPWPDFQPKILRMSIRPIVERGDDAVPPESPSPPSSTGDGQETSSPTSDPVSHSPTRGSRQRTSAQ